MAFSVSVMSYIFVRIGFKGFNYLLQLNLVRLEVLLAHGRGQYAGANKSENLSKRMEQESCG